MCWMESDWTSYPPPSLREYRTDLTSATQAYRINKYAEDRRKPGAALERAEAMGLGTTAMMTNGEAGYTHAALQLVPRNSSVDSDVAVPFSVSTFVWDAANTLQRRS